METPMKSHNFIIANGDTDGLAFKKPDEKPWTETERAALLTELNALMPENIVWKDDKTYRRMIVFAAKNYVMDDGKKVTIKGNSLKATKKAPALRAFIREIIDLLLKDRKEQAIFAYLAKAIEIGKIQDITPWCFKATVTKKVLKPEEHNVFQKKILAAIGTTPVSEGDKVYLFYNEDGSLSLRENFKGSFDKSKLLGALKDTVKVFRRVFDVELFPNLKLKRNVELLASLVPKPEPLNAAEEVASWTEDKKANIQLAFSEKLTLPTGIKVTRI
jgi:DNA polymerase elongation subunit (family B)